MNRRTTRSYESNEEILERFEAAISSLEAWDIELRPGSRFARYLERFRATVAEPDRLVPVAQVHQLQFDLREIDEFVAIVESFPGAIAQVARDRMTTMLGGAEDADSEAESAGRDAQWELYLRALLRRAQIPAGLSEPDVIATVRGRQVPIEAKRPKTEKRLDDRLRKGVSQLEAEGSPGLVAFSLDRAIRLGRGALYGSSVHQVEHRVDELVGEVIERNREQIARRVVDRPVLGLVFHARLPTWVEPDDFPLLVSATRVEPISRDPEVNAIIDRLMEGLRHN